MQTCSKLKLQKNVLVNNCHLKVGIENKQNIEVHPTLPVERQQPN